MRTVDETTAAGIPPRRTEAPDRGRAARAGVPTFPLPHEKAQAAARTARPARSNASTG